MESELKEKTSEYLKSHRKMTLATITPDNKPISHTLEYASDGTVVYFATNNKTRKAQNIINNPDVAYSVDEDYEDWMKIQGIQIQGKATILSKKSDIDAMMKIFLSKFPFLANFPPNPDLIFVKIEPTEGYFLDYTKGFAHRDKIIF